MLTNRANEVPVDWLDRIESAGIAVKTARRFCERFGKNFSFSVDHILIITRQQEPVCPFAEYFLLSAGVPLAVQGDLVESLC
jgi:hypothetical protein